MENLAKNSSEEYIAESKSICAEPHQIREELEIVYSRRLYLNIDSGLAVRS